MNATLSAYNIKFQSIIRIKECLSNGRQTKNEKRDRVIINRKFETCLWYQEEEKDAYSSHGRNAVYLLCVLKVFVFCFCAPVETRHRVTHKQ